MITVIPMTPAHIDSVHIIESHSFADPWPKEDILTDLAQPYSISFVALENDLIVGYVSARHIINEGHICNIAVHEDFRQKGIASALLEALIEVAISREMIGLTLEVRVGNRAAMALYHKYGFIVEGYRRGYYSYPTEDAAIMWKYISEVHK